MIEIRTKFKEVFTRSFAKVVTWRIAVTITNFIGGWLASGNPWVGLGVVSFALVVNSALYFVHERMWNASDWGKIAKEEETDPPLGV